MSIPLDRLYDHLHNKSNHDMLIYRWLPHGSKKLEDLCQLSDSLSKKWHTAMTMPTVIMHDQEPLNFDLWSKNDFAEYQDHMFKKFNMHNYCTSADYIEYQTSLHLRGITDPASGLYDLMILVHSEKNSAQVAKYQQHNFLPVYYWCHALIAIDWFRYAEHDPVLDYDIDNFKYDFLIYNRAWAGSREYRLKFAELIANHHLVSQCLTTFSAIDNGKSYIDHQFKNPALSIEHNRLHQIYQPNQHPSSASADYNHHDYSTTGIEVVLETLFDDSRLHLTEKTLRPIACGKPFILASTPGSLQYLRDYGFETFEKYIDESYDLIIDPTKRLEAIVLEMQRISSLTTDQKTQLWQTLNIIAKKNQQLFFSKKWQEHIEQEFYTNLDNAMIIMNQNCTGKYWHKLMSFTQFAGKTLEQIQTLHQWLKDRN